MCCGRQETDPVAHTCKLTGNPKTRSAFPLEQLAPKDDFLPGRTLPIYRHTAIHQKSLLRDEREDRA